MEGKFSYDVEYDMVCSQLLMLFLKNENKNFKNVFTQDYAIQKLLLYYDTPNQWPVAYERSKVPLKILKLSRFITLSY